jgi:hypothetical protein
MSIVDIWRLCYVLVGLFYSSNFVCRIHVFTIMVGRYKNNEIDDLGYVLIKNDRKYWAKCLTCKKSLTNTAVSRLKSHRYAIIIIIKHVFIQTMTFLGMFVNK